MSLRSTKVRNILASATDSALLAVEIYNKPRTTFKREAYTTLMSIAWTKLFHAFFQQKMGDKYYYKEKNGRYKTVDGDKKSWELDKCINEFIQQEPSRLSQSTIANLHFFIKLRNKIEHRYVESSEIDNIVFGECQSLLYNFESLIVNLFGEEFAISENLAFSLQFSRTRTKEQVASSRIALSRDVLKLRQFIQDYKNTLSEEVFQSQEYSIKLIQVPKISNTTRADTAIEFVKWNELSNEDKEKYSKLTAIIKDKIIKKEVINAGKFKAGGVIERVNIKSREKINQADHVRLYLAFSIRPPTNISDEREKFETNTKYCTYDEVHDDYVYTQEWIDWLIKLFNELGFTKAKLKKANTKKTILSFGQKVY